MDTVNDTYLPDKTIYTIIAIMLGDPAFGHITH